MKILLTNDDGYNSCGITALAAALQNAGHETLMVAPDRNRSGSACAMTITGSLALKKNETAQHVLAHSALAQRADEVWLCNGTPVDCVVTVLSGAIDFKPDVVVSGINAGANLGTDILYSGTASAARQGALAGLPSIALSLCAEGGYYWEEAARWSASHLQALIELTHADAFVNVNMPNLAALPNDFVMSFPSRRRYTETLVAKGEDSSGWRKLELTSFDVASDYAPDSDTALVEEGKISVCRVYLHPLRLDDVNINTSKKT